MPVRRRDRDFDCLTMATWRESRPASGAGADHLPIHFALLDRSYSAEARGGGMRMPLALVLCILLAFFVTTGAGRADGRGPVGARALAASIEAAKIKLAPAIASAVHLVDHADQAELSFDLTRPVDAHAFVLAAPDRIVIDLPEVDFRIDPRAGGATLQAHHRRSIRDRHHSAGFSGLVASFRFGLFAPGRSRIVINLSGPARIQRVTTETGVGGQQSVLVITLTKSSRTAILAEVRKSRRIAAAEAIEPKPAPIPATAASPSDLPVVVVDPGHGGVDSGAIVNGLVEKNVVLAFAKMLAAKLTATGHYKVVMTRDSDVFIPLEGRVRIARNAHAALFVSIHADTIADAASVSGATIYTMSDRASDAEAARTAEKENQADATAGLEEGKKAPNRRVSDILFDLTRQETRAYSHVFARTLANYWKVVGRLNKNPERAAGFIVLTAPDVPSVLLELGYLSNVKDSRSLVSPAWRDETTSKVVAAINTFFDKVGTGNKTTAPAQVVEKPAALIDAAASQAGMPK
jgi:N-acetylmuramoyl-L-alanine amidase